MGTDGDEKWSKDRPAPSVLRGGGRKRLGAAGWRKVQRGGPGRPARKAFRGLRCSGEARKMKPEGSMLDLAMRRSLGTRGFHECLEWAQREWQWGAGACQLFRGLVL